MAHPFAVKDPSAERTGVGVLESQQSLAAALLALQPEHNAATPT